MRLITSPAEKSNQLPPHDDVHTIAIRDAAAADAAAAVADDDDHLGQDGRDGDQ